MQGERIEAARAAFDRDRGRHRRAAAARVLRGARTRCARALAADLAEEAIVRAMGDGTRPTAPLFTDLIGAHLEAGDGPDRAVLEIMRHHNVTEDAPTHTAIIQARAQLGAIRRTSGAILRTSLTLRSAHRDRPQGYLRHRDVEGAWEVFDAMRTGQIPEHRPDGKHIVPVEPDAVTFTAMIMACAYRDDFEQSRALLLDMKQSAIESTLSVHNALINACASRAHSLANLGKAKKNQLQRLKVETDPAVALLKATQQLGQLEDEGHAPDGYTYLALLRCCAGAGEVARPAAALEDARHRRGAERAAFDALLRVRARAVDQAERPVERPPEGCPPSRPRWSSSVWK